MRFIGHRQFYRCPEQHTCMHLTSSQGPMTQPPALPRGPRGLNAGTSATIWATPPPPDLCPVPWVLATGLQGSWEWHWGLPGPFGLPWPCPQQAARMKTEALLWVVTEVATLSSELPTSFSVAGHSSWPSLSLRQTSLSLTGRVQQGAQRAGQASQRRCGSALCLSPQASQPWEAQLR